MWHREGLSSASGDAWTFGAGEQSHTFAQRRPRPKCLGEKTPSVELGVGHTRVRAGGGEPGGGRPSWPTTDTRAVRTQREDRLGAGPLSRAVAAVDVSSALGHPSPPNLGSLCCPRRRASPRSQSRHPHRRPSTPPLTERRARRFLQACVGFSSALHRTTSAWTRSPAPALLHRARPLGPAATLGLVV